MQAATVNYFMMLHLGMLLHWHLAAQRTRNNMVSEWLIPCFQKRKEEEKRKRSDRALTCWESEVHRTIALLQYAANDVHSLPALSLSPSLAACTMGTAAVQREQDTPPLLSRQPLEGYDVAADIESHLFRQAR